MDDSQPTIELRKHGVLYFHDGNIALAANVAQKSRAATQETSAAASVIMVFRVHRGVLETHSSVLRDMFSLPAAPEANEMYEGVPLVTLPDDAEGWEKLLGILYHTK